jgi:hypothetical protein
MTIARGCCDSAGGITARHSAAVRQRGGIYGSACRFQRIERGKGSSVSFSDRSMGTRSPRENHSRRSHAEVIGKRVASDGEVSVFRGVFCTRSLDEARSTRPHAESFPCNPSDPLVTRKFQEWCQLHNSNRSCHCCCRSAAVTRKRLFAPRCILPFG